MRTRVTCGSSSHIKRLVRWRIGESVNPAAGAFQVSLQEHQPGAQGACPVIFAAALLQVKLADRLHHLPGFRTLPLDLMDQRQARNGITISSYLGYKAIFDDLGKVLRGSLQLIALIIHQPRYQSPQFFMNAIPLRVAPWSSTCAICLVCSSWPVWR